MTSACSTSASASSRRPRAERARDRRGDAAAHRAGRDHLHQHHAGKHQRHAGQRVGAEPRDPERLDQPGAACASMTRTLGQAMRSSIGTIGACSSARVRGSSARGRYGKPGGRDGDRASHARPDHTGVTCFMQATPLEGWGTIPAHASARLSIVAKGRPCPNTVSAGLDATYRVRRCDRGDRHCRTHAEHPPPHHALPRSGSAGRAAAHLRARLARAVDHVAPPARALRPRLRASRPTCAATAAPARRATAAYALEHIVHDMTDLLHASAHERATGSGTTGQSRWCGPGGAASRPCHGVVSLCVPYFPDGFAPEKVIPLADRDDVSGSEISGRPVGLPAVLPEDVRGRPTAFEADVAPRSRRCTARAAPQARASRR